MIVMIALYIWIISEVYRQEIFYSLIRLSRDSSVELDSGFFKGALRSRSYSAADQSIHSLRLKEPRQRSVTVSVCSQYLRFTDLSIVYLVYFKLLGMSEMLKYLSILISYCYLHDFLRLFFILICKAAAVQLITS